MTDILPECVKFSKGGYFLQDVGGDVKRPFGRNFETGKLVELPRSCYIDGNGFTALTRALSGVSGLDWLAKPINSVLSLIPGYSKIQRTLSTVSLLIPSMFYEASTVAHMRIGGLTYINMAGKINSQLSCDDVEPWKGATAD